MTAKAVVGALVAGAFSQVPLLAYAIITAFLCATLIIILVLIRGISARGSAKRANQPTTHFALHISPWRKNRKDRRG